MCRPFTRGCLVILLACVGCKERERARPGPTPATAIPRPPPVTDAGRATPVSDAGAGDDPLAEKLRHCPLTVDGASTTIRDVEGGVEVVVTAADAAGVADIRRRAAHLVAFSLGQAQGGVHGGGAGGGFMKDCPVVAKDTEITSTAVDGGARLIVRPARRALSVDALRAETRRRHQQLEQR